MTFEIRKTANTISIVADCGTIFKTWYADEFTERKLANAMKKIAKDLNGYGQKAEFIRTF